MKQRILTWLNHLSATGRFLLIIGTTLAVGTAMNVAAQNGSNGTNEQTAPQVQTPPKPVVTHSITNETQPIPFETSNVDDPNSYQGTSSVRIEGVNGVKTLTYDTTITDGVTGPRKLSSEVVTTPPVTKVIANGTLVKPTPKPTSNCSPNYSGCVPIASDVDCLGGSGNGPAYVAGPVYVTGADIYGLDRDGDGVGCE